MTPARSFSGQPPAPPRSWGTAMLLAALVLLVTASFATLPLQWSAFATPEAASTTLEFSPRWTAWSRS